jgi:deoxyribonuclease-1
LRFFLYSIAIFFISFCGSYSQVEKDSVVSSGHSVRNFREAKKYLGKIYNDHRIDFYCGCNYDVVKLDGYTRSILDPTCGITPRKDPIRSPRIEWEHIVPAHAFGSQLPCWRENLCERRGQKFKGRKCCVRIDPIFSQMEADLHNIRPVPGEINGDRSNFHFGLIHKQIQDYGTCRFKVDFPQKIAEPREEIRGDIARTYFYMEEKYGIRISHKRRNLYRIWDRQDPPDSWEKKRNSRIEKIQGNTNPFIDKWVDKDTL